MYDQADSTRKTIDKIKLELASNQVSNNIPNDLASLQKINIDNNKWQQLISIFAGYGIDIDINNLTNQINFIIQQLEQAIIIKKYKPLLYKIDKLQQQSK